MPPTIILIRHAQALHNVDHKYPPAPLQIRIKLTIPHKTTKSLTPSSQSSDVSNVKS